MVCPEAAVIAICCVGLAPVVTARVEVVAVVIDEEAVPPISIVIPPVPDGADVVTITVYVVDASIVARGV
jgi:hypothetical protein